MNGVVLRCPHCGTTKAAAGECEACHDAQVRYYCTSHTPGHWLDGAVCPECGAKFGAPAYTPAAPATPRPGPASAPPPVPRPKPRRPYPPREAPRTDGRARSRRERTPPPVGEGIGPDDSVGRAPHWRALLLAAARARSMRREAEPVTRGRGGCFLRALLLVAVLFLVLVSGLGGFVIPLFRIF